MTPAERRLRRSIQRQVAMLQPALQREVLGAFDTLRTLLDDAALERVIRETGLGAVGVLSEDMLDEAFAKLRIAVQRTLRDGTIAAARRVPGVDPRAVFDVLNPNVIQAVRKLDTRVITTLKDSVRETFRDTIQAGLETGAGPRATARRVRATIGMAPNQARAVSNFEKMLGEGDPEALTRKLRDRRFDRTLRKAFVPGGAGLRPDQIKRMTAAYERRMIAFNAEVNARTATLDALKSGQRLSWERAVDLGVVDRERLMKRWSTVGDGRVRSEHRAVNGQVRHIDERYSTGEIIAGDQSFNCRCLDVYYQAQFVEAGA